MKKEVFRETFTSPAHLFSESEAQKILDVIREAPLPMLVEKKLMAM